jgi:hypothetical protein
VILCAVWCSSFSSAGFTMAALGKWHAAFGAWAIAFVSLLLPWSK